MRATAHIHPPQSIPRAGTVGEFAAVLRKDATVLLEQLLAAGVPAEDENSTLTEADKRQLLCYLQASHGAFSVDQRKIPVVVRGKQQTIHVSTSSVCVHCIEVDPTETTASERNEGSCRGGVLFGFNNRVGALYQIIGRGFRSTFTDRKVWYELFTAFMRLHGRPPELQELDALNKAASIFEESSPNARATLVHQVIARIHAEVDPKYADVVDAAVYALVSRGKSGNKLSRYIFKALYAKGLPTTQARLRAGSGSKALSSVASAAWRLLRQKHFLPSCVATISLA